jgi:hypothetical protein
MQQVQDVAASLEPVDSKVHLLLPYVGLFAYFVIA